MMTSLGIELLIIVLLLAANGVLAMTEIAVVSARKPRLRRLAETGDLRARAALELAESPNRFLATVQVGITLVGVLAGAFGGATVAEQIATARGFLVGQAAQTKNKQNCGSEIGDCSQTCRHVFLPLTCGTWPACAGSRRNRRTY